MKSKKFSTAVTAGCIIALIILIAVAKCGGQSTVLIGTSTGLQTVPGRLTITQPEKWYSLRTYKPFTPVRITRASLSLCQGVINGMSEAFHKDPFVFEKTLGAGPVSFWGHRQDELQYDKNGKHKSEFFNAFRDLHHFDEALDKFGNGSIYLSIGISKICEINRSYKKGIKPRHIWRDIFLDCVITSAVQTATKSITYSAFTDSRLFHF